MNRSKQIVDFYIISNNLKNKIRNGWKEIEISKDRLESVAEHIFGCLLLAIAIDSEYNLQIDMLKVLKMLILHETEEILMKDFTIRDNISKGEKDKLGMQNVLKVTNGLIKQDEIINLINEFNERKTKEAKFCYHIDKIEADMQAKMYDMNGYFSLEKAKEDLPYYGTRASEIENKAKTASDFWIEYDRPKYDDDEIFKNLLNEIQRRK